MARISEYIFYNINESNLYYDFYGMRFYFSSSLNLDKFKNKYFEFITKEGFKIKRKYDINIDYKYFLMIALYKKIEHRGFRITFNKEPLNINDIKIIFNV